MKILIVGNSQVACVKIAHGQFKELTRGVADVSFYCFPGAIGPSLVVENGCLAIMEGTVNKDYPPFSSPPNTQDRPLRDFGAIVVCALGYIGGGFTYPYPLLWNGILHDYRPKDNPLAGNPISKSCYREIIRANLANQHGIQFLTHLREAYHGEIIVQPFPGITADAPSREDWIFNTMYEDGAGAYGFFSEVRNDYLAELCSRLSIDLLPYPEAARRGDHFSPPEFMKKPDGLHPDSHYGKLVLEQILDRVCPNRGEAALSRAQEPEFTMTAGEEFSRQVAIDRITPFLQHLALLTNQGDSLPFAECTQEIDHAEREVHGLVGSYFGSIREKALGRRFNLEHYADVDFISLGEDGFCRTLATRWGLSAGLQDRTSPFDLAVHPLPQIAGLINSDFADYINPAALQFSEEKNFCRNETINVSFNHELGARYADNNFSLLRQIYSRRIEKFRTLMSTGGRIVFLLHIFQPRPNALLHLKNVSRALKKRFQAADMLLVCINTCKTAQTWDQSKVELLRKESIEILDASYPAENHFRNDPKFCTTAEGHAFERDLVKDLTRIVDRWYE